MKLAVRISSYFLGAMMLIGTVSLASMGYLDVGQLFAFILVEAQVVLTLIYVHKK